MALDLDRSPRLDPHDSTPNTRPRIIEMTIVRRGTLEMATDKSFTAVIVTPSGVPLGGDVIVHLFDDGRYAVQYHMHCSSAIGSFNFQIRAYLSAPEMPVLFFYHEGHISGVGDVLPPETGENPIIRLYWGLIQSFRIAGRFKELRVGRHSRGGAGGRRRRRRSRIGRSRVDARRDSRNRRRCTRLDRNPHRRRRNHRCHRGRRRVRGCRRHLRDGRRRRVRRRDRRRSGRGP